jgi:hypothetical protein
VQLQAAQGATREFGRSKQPRSNAAMRRKSAVSRPRVNRSVL